MEILEQIDVERWDGPFPAQVTANIAASLEAGKVLFAPRLHFELTGSERRFLSPAYLDGKSKNISYRPATGALGGTKSTGAECEELVAMLRRYYERSYGLLQALCPQYRESHKAGIHQLSPGRNRGTSLVVAEGRHAIARRRISIAAASGPAYFARVLERSSVRSAHVAGGRAVRTGRQNVSAAGRRAKCVVQLDASDAPHY
jgi:hypothetical protein